MAAHYVLAVLAIAFCSANAAGVESYAPALRLFNHQKPESLITAGCIRYMHSEEMQVAILYFAQWNAELVFARP